MSRLAAAVLLSIACAACARPFPPSGGERDNTPPRLVRTTPEHESVLNGFTGEVIFEFDETLSERGLADVLSVSPETGAAELDRDGNRLKVRIEGGWKPGTVYRVIIGPGIQDRFNNARREPAEVIFSTGPPLTPAAIAGFVRDRITGRPAMGIRVVANAMAGDTLPHSTVTDSAGFFGLRFLPPARYNIRAYEDANRNRRLDPREKRAEAAVILGTARDTQVVELEVLAADTTPARLVRAEPRDSTQIRLIFDDYLDPAQFVGELQVALFQLPDSTPVPAGRLLRVRDFERTRAAEDSLRRARADTAARAVAAPPARPALPPVDTARLLPAQDLVFIPVRALRPRTRYRIIVGEVRNVAGVPGGGGSVSFTMPARGDTTAVRRDTIDAPRRFR